ncbi:hypothetical protein IFM46972_08995 [Aspergillus udagawae]|uniref:Uncharacterized protein n=1 Tax=Aspergillus udagawae TaxID=91492 RepID=A0A8H3PAH6_9EURO|nr:hypothetical protein IFM46972_08995 [Aspergillus udagawae]
MSCAGTKPKQLVIQNLELGNNTLKYPLSYSEYTTLFRRKYPQTGDGPTLTQKIALPALRLSDIGPRY